MFLAFSTMVKLNLWNRFQSFINWLKRWLSNNWQLLILSLLGIYLPLLGFSLLALQIWQHQGGLVWDVSIMMAIHSVAQPTLDQFVVNLTQFGTVWGVIPATVLISFGLLYARRWRSLTYLLTAMIGCGAINHAAKALLHRVRPSLWDYPHLTSFSFPSGHAMASMTFVAALVILLWGTKWRLAVLLLGSVFVVAIGCTRLYLGVHYPSDVIAGWMIAIAWAVGTSLIVKPQLTQPVVEDQSVQSVEELAVSSER